MASSAAAGTLDLFEQLYKRLTVDTNLTAFVTGGFSTGDAPEGAEYPYGVIVPVVNALYKRTAQTHYYRVIIDIQIFTNRFEPNAKLCQMTMATVRYAPFILNAGKLTLMDERSIRPILHNGKDGYWWKGIVELSAIVATPSPI